jgi:hypothetical protein
VVRPGAAVFPDFVFAFLLDFFSAFTAGLRCAAGGLSVLTAAELAPFD